MIIPRSLVFLWSSLAGSIVAATAASPIQVPQIKWQLDSGAPIRGGIAREGGRLFFGNSAGAVWCVDANTAETVWRWAAGGAIVATPAVGAGQVVVSSRDGFVYALDARDGRVNWKFALGPETPHPWGWDYYMASPVIAGNRVLIGAGDHHLYALELANGALAWKFATGDKVRATPRVLGDRVYAPGFDGYVYALALETGQLERKFATDGVGFAGQNFGWDRTAINSSPAWRDGQLVFGARDGILYKVDSVTFEPQWKFTYGSTWCIGSPAVADDRVFVGWSDNHFFSAVSFTTGQELWHQDCGAYVYSSPAVDEHNVYVGAMNGRIFGFDQASGAVRWSYQTDGAVLSSPLLADGVLYVGNDAGHLFAISDAGEVHRAVYDQQEYAENELAAGKAVAPYLRARGYAALDPETLEAFLRARISDHQPAVVVVAHAAVPDAVLGANVAASLLQEFMDAGGTIIWLASLPDFWSTDEKLNITGFDPTFAAELLGLDFDVHMDLATYHATATAAGRAWGLPATFDAPGSSIGNSAGLVPLALNEFGRIAAFYRPFGERSGAGFVFFRSWSLLPVQPRDLETLERLVDHGLAGRTTRSDQ